MRSLRWIVPASALVVLTAWWLWRPDDGPRSDSPSADGPLKVALELYFYSSAVQIRADGNDSLTRLQRIEEGLRNLPQLEKERGVEYSVLVRPRSDTPWQHVQWLLHSLASTGASRVYLDLRAATGDAFDLWRDPSSMDDIGGEVSMPLVFRSSKGRRRVEIRPSEEGLDLWPPDAVYQAVVRVPTDVVFRFGERQTGDVEELRAWAAEVVDAGGADAGFEVVALDPRVPARFVTAAVHVLREVSGAPVGLPTEAPPEAALERAGLPYPD